jgi:hypothetical protein
VSDHRYGSSDAADSAGQAWAGRAFQANPSSGDDGAADPALLEALTAMAERRGSRVSVIEALRGARLLVPLLAEAGDVGLTPDGRRVDKTQELSLVTVEGPGGRTVLPAFTSVDTMRAWDPSARPIPAEAPRIALAAGAEGSGVVLDPGSPTEFALRRPALAALATGDAWQPAWDADVVWDAYGAFMADEPDVLAIDIGPVQEDSTFFDPEVGILLTVSPDLPGPLVQALVARADQVWRALDETLFDGPTSVVTAATVSAPERLR